MRNIADRGRERPRKRRMSWVFDRQLISWTTRWSQRSTPGSGAGRGTRMTVGRDGRRHRARTLTGALAVLLLVLTAGLTGVTQPAAAAIPIPSPTAAPAVNAAPAVKAAPAAEAGPGAKSVAASKPAPARFTNTRLAISPVFSRTLTGGFDQAGNTLLQCSRLTNG